MAQQDSSHGGKPEVSRTSPPSSTMAPAEGSISDLDRIKLATVFNISSYNYLQHQQAKDIYNVCKQDVQRSKAEATAFPVAYARARSKRDAAKLELEKLARESDESSNSLGLLMLNLSKFTTTIAQPRSQPTDSDEWRRGISEQIAVQMAETATKQDLEERMTQLERLIQQRMQASEVRETERIRELEAKYTVLETKIIHKLEGLEARLHNTLQELSGRVDTAFQGLEKAEEAFDKIYGRLEDLEKTASGFRSIEDRLASQATVDADIMRNSEDTWKRVASLEDQVSKLNSPGSLSNADAPRHIDLANPTTHSLRDVELYLQNIFTYTSQRAGSLDKSIETIRGEMQSAIDLQQNPISKIGVQVGEMQAKLASIEFNTTAAGMAKNTQTNTGLDDIQTKISHLENTLVGFEQQNTKFAMVVQHLTKRVEEISMEEIIMKLNLSLRNVSQKSLNNLVSQVQALSNSVDALKRGNGMSMAVAIPPPGAGGPS